MLARRGRLSIKPNLAKGGQRSTVTEDKHPKKEEKSERSEEVVDGKTKGNLVPLPFHEGSEKVVGGEIEGHFVPVPFYEGSEGVVGGEIEGNPALVLAELPDHAVTKDVPSWPPPEKKRISRVIDSPESSARDEYMDVTENKNERKKFNGEETLDTKTMRIMDMIYWNPKKGQVLSRKRHNTDHSSSSQPSSPTKPTLSSPARPAAPQVKIGPDGNIILDESSLVVQGTQNETSFWETVDDDRIGRKTTSLSFRNRLWRKGTQWTEKETELFYEILRCTGPDFSLMHEYFPARARCELKSKYNREEKTNWNKLKEVMSMPMVLDETLNNRVARLQKQIEEEAEEKAKEKLRRSKIGFPDIAKPTCLKPATIDWNEDEADLIAEAEEIIHALEKETKRQARAAGNFSESSSSTGESSEDDDFVKQKKSDKKKYSEAARKIIMAVRKQAKEHAASKKRERDLAKQAPKTYSATEDAPLITDDDPDAVREAYPVSSQRRDGITDPVLLRAARKVVKAHEKRIETASKLNSSATQSQEKGEVQPSAADKEEKEKTTEESDVTVIDNEQSTSGVAPQPRQSSSAVSAPKVFEEAELTLKSPQSKLLSRTRRPPVIPKKPKVSK